jgi:hypothetical protein
MEGYEEEEDACMHAKDTRINATDTPQDTQGGVTYVMDM